MAVEGGGDVFFGKLTHMLDWAANAARKNSLWPMPFATACCGIELMAVVASRTTSPASAPRPCASARGSAT